MAALTSQTLEGANADLLELTAQTPTTGGDNVPCDGYTAVLVVNNAVGSANFTIQAQTDQDGRATNLTQAMPTTTAWLFGPFGKVPGWATPTGRLGVLAGTPATTDVYVLSLSQE